MDKNKTAETSSTEPEIKFSRELGLLEATTLGVGAMIGAGIFILSGMAAGIAGPAATISYVLCGLMTLFTALSYSELSSSIPLAGGGYTFVHQGLGGYIAFLSGWALIFGSVVACALYALGFAEHFTPLLDLVIKVSPPIKFSAFAIALLLLLINIKGTKESGKTQNFFTITKVAMLIIFIGLCIPYVKVGNLKPFAPFGFTGIISATALIYISFFGFELISSASEEIKNPKKTVPKAILLSLFIPMLIYVGVVLVSVGILDYQTLGTSAAPLVLIAGKVLGNYGLLFVLIAGLLATISALNATVMAAARQTYAMGRDGYLPGKIFRLHPKFKTPYTAVAAVGVVILFFTLSGEVKFAAHLANFCFLFALILVNLSVIMLRKKEPRLKRPFKLPWHPVIPLLAIACNVLILAFMSHQTYLLGAGWLGLGSLVYLVYSKEQKETVEKHRRLKEILQRQERKEYRILVPVANPNTLGMLMTTACAIAKKFDGEVIALNVVEILHGTPLRKGLADFSQQRLLLSRAENIARQEKVKFDKLIKLTHRLSYGILETAEEEDCNFIIMGRSRPEKMLEKILTTVMDIVLKEAPCNVAVVCGEKMGQVRRIVITATDNVNSFLAAELSPALVEKFKADLLLLHAIPQDSGAEEETQAKRWIDSFMEKANLKIKSERKILKAEKPAEAIAGQVQEGDLLFMGESKGGPLEQLLFTSVPEEVDEKISQPIIVFKKFQPRERSWVERIIAGKKVGVK
ncbi:MAG: amino acid permease [candidate division Zixibacteria bacterium]|nr:amino acid permease [candidate division Zixibacteria bacterium]